MSGSAMTGSGALGSAGPALGAFAPVATSYVPCTHRRAAVCRAVVHVERRGTASARRRQVRRPFDRRLCATARLMMFRCTFTRRLVAEGIIDLAFVKTDDCLLLVQADAAHHLFAALQAFMRTMGFVCNDDKQQPPAEERRE